MTAIETAVARHYGRGGLEEAILAGLEAMGHEGESLSPAALAPVDEFHMGGREATTELAAGLALDRSDSVLDIGCGIGGTARFLAETYGCHVTGIDLTPEYVAVAESLSRRVGLAERVSFRVASAFELPFEGSTFDVATLLHVGMNIPDKARLAAEAHRVLKPYGTFAVYDVMRIGEGELRFPVPWSTGPETSFLETPEHYREALESAGFRIASQTDRREMAKAFFARMRARIAEQGVPPLGLHILMGETAPVKVANMIEFLTAGIIAPVEMIARRV
jgi:ubiquinone/menaquinone biosynthesis C-methylase UbiE